jgi:hypothetical protein
MTYRPYNVLISQAQASGVSSIEYTLENTSGNPISSLVPVTTSSSGGFKAIDVTNETDALNIVGVTKENILNASNGQIVATGRILNVSLPFPLNSTVWVAKDGTLIDEVPEIDVNGFEELDFVIRVGKIVKNQTNPLEKDLIVKMELIGQL